MGIVLRDIKPANILLESGVDHVNGSPDPSGSSARAADDASVTQSGVVAGTPMYMAPEQAMGEALTDHRADLFSLGSVMYQMCTGRPAVRRLDYIRGPQTRRRRHAPRPMRERGHSGSPEWLCAIVARLHAKDPTGDGYANRRRKWPTS